MSKPLWWSLVPPTLVEGYMEGCVNLDALIPRDDFESISEDKPARGDINTFKATELEAGSVGFQPLRKPDFQRETANWSPEKVSDFISCFIEQELIPSVIMWQSPLSGNIFVIDGAHRLSALVAWVQDDYGDGKRSRKFFGPDIPAEQISLAVKCRELVNARVGSYEELKGASLNPSEFLPEKVRRGRFLGHVSIGVQMVKGESGKAETSFYKINQSATPIDDVEMKIIRSRKKPNAIAARAILRHGVGHKYWSAFPAGTQLEIEQLAEGIHEILFRPYLDGPIRTLDLPMAGEAYSAQGLRIIFDLVNFLNKVPRNPDEVDVDENGDTTVKYLRNVLRACRQICSNHNSSLQLHPAVYFYGITGKYVAGALLACFRFFDGLNSKRKLDLFIRKRRPFEEFLIKHRSFLNGIVKAKGSGTRSVGTIIAYYGVVFDGVVKDKKEEEILEDIRDTKQLKYIPVGEEQDGIQRRNLTKYEKAAVYIDAKLQSEVRCGICEARVPSSGGGLDHIHRRRDGGSNQRSNLQIAHPYCNTGFKN